MNSKYEISAINHSLTRLQALGHRVIGQWVNQVLIPLKEKKEYKPLPSEITLLVSTNVECGVDIGLIDGQYFIKDAFTEEKIINIKIVTELPNNFEFWVSFDFNCNTFQSLKEFADVNTLLLLTQLNCSKTENKTQSLIADNKSLKEELETAIKTINSLKNELELLKSDKEILIRSLLRYKSYIIKLSNGFLTNYDYNNDSYLTSLLIKYSLYS